MKCMMSVGAVIILAIVTNGEAAAQSADTASVREAASAQITADIAAGGGSTWVEPGRVFVDTLQPRGLLRVWSASLGADHASRLLVGLDSLGGVYPLGGFPRPELVAVNRVMGLPRGTRTAVRDRAEELVGLADSYGGEELYFPEQADDRAALEREWGRKRPRDWPRDTVAASRDGSTLVRVTVLSHRVRSLSPVWTPMTYAFVFAPNGELLAWSRREAAWLPNVRDT